jgi:hypothetical protein
MSNVRKLWPIVITAGFANHSLRPNVPVKAKSFPQK